MTTFNFSRSTSYFESGIGRGMGFREPNQDLLGFMHLIPERARERILDLAATQLPTGGAYHQYQPLTKRGNNDIGSNFNDDPLWLVLSVSAYLKETGDWAILDAPVVFDNQAGSEQPLYAHLQKSIQYTQDRIGPHGLPLIGRADWNDCLNLNCFSDQPGQSFQTTTNKDGLVAESVFIAGLFVLASKEMEEIAGRTVTSKKQPASAPPGWRWKQTPIWLAGTVSGSSGLTTISANRLARRIAPRAISISNRRECASWPALGSKTVRPAWRSNSVAKHLACKHGIVLLSPAYKQYHLHIGEISSYPPGYKENGSVFCHTNPWVMIAETRVGRGDKAHDYYSRINPSALEDESELHRTEPYVYSQMISGPEAVLEGEAKNSWLTGTAAWNYVAITQHILGVRPGFDGLQIEPVFPTGWKKFEVQRTFRGVRYHINVERVGPGNQVEIAVNGQTIKGTCIPLSTPTAQDVEVTVKVS